MNHGGGHKNVKIALCSLTSAKVLAHFDPELPLGLACDASAVGIGAMLFHRYQYGTERPVAYTSKSLAKAEKNWSQIEHGLSVSSLE